MVTAQRQPRILIADSGIQFMAYSFSCESTLTRTAFIRASAQGPLRVVDCDAAGHYYYRASPDSAVEWVRPDYSFSLSESLEFLQHRWLPIPYLSPTGSGPTNWARAYISSPQTAGGKIVLAFDTAVAKTISDVQPSQFDVQQEQLFALPSRCDQWYCFIEQAWVSHWLSSLLPPPLNHCSPRVPAFIWQAHYINLLKVLAQQVSPHPVLLRALQREESAIAVEAIIDVGNTNSCGVLYEAGIEDTHPLAGCSEIVIRDLSCPTNAPCTLFSSEINFSAEPFGDNGLSSASGRMDAFQWYSLLRMGPEAERLNSESHTDLHYQGVTSPRRYLWDDHPSPFTWFNAPQVDGASYSSIDHPFSLLLDDGGGLHTSRADRFRVPVFKPQFSRATLFTFFIAELLCQIANQINSYDYRQKMNRTTLPRYINRINFTLPVNFTALERKRFQALTQQAIDLIRAAQPQFFPLTGHIELVFPWDEASCGQLVWLWQKLHEHSISTLLQRYRHSTLNDPLRIALIDVGGGTTDLAITDYYASRHNDDEAQALTPHLIYRQGVSVAGDNILLVIIRQFLLPQLTRYLREQGVSDIDTLFERLFCRGKSRPGDTPWRQYMVRHLFLPLVDDILQRYQLSETAYSCRVEHFIEQRSLDFVERTLMERVMGLTSSSTQLQLRGWCIEFPFSDLVETLQSTQNGLYRLLELLSDTVTENHCDIVLLGGQSLDLPVFQQIFTDRHAAAYPLSALTLDTALPFCTKGKLANGKQANSLGALIYRLAEQQLTSEYGLVAGDSSTTAVARWFGPLNQQGRLQYPLVSPPYQGKQRTIHTLNSATSMGYRCIDMPDIVATPLFALLPDRHTLHNLALGISVELEWDFDAEGELCELPRVISLRDSQQQLLDPLSVVIEMNTLSVTGDPHDSHWRDDGNIMAAYDYSSTSPS